MQESTLTYFIFKNSSAERNDGCEESKTRTGVPEENADRGNWTTKREYILSMVGYAVGLGNVWRFPYLAYKNGGGAFLIPYFLMLAVAGLPMFFLECSLGQFCSQGPINVWKAVPIMQGVGVTMVLVSTLVAVYYNVIVGYSIYYMFTSFQFPLPWSECFRWSDGNCSTTPTDSCGDMAANVTSAGDHNDSCLAPNNISTAVKSPSEQYWDKVALRRTGGLEETGEIVWHLALCLLLAWLLTGAALFKGIKSSGKVVYFTATFPYVVLFILVVRGLTLDGARDGIEYYIGSQSNLTKLAEAEVWKDAVTQIFYSLSVAWGGLTALSSYNKFHNNCYKDSIIICAVNCGTSIFAGFAIFSILGHMAHVYGKPVSEVVQSDFALAFVAYPEALSQLPVSPLWSVLFFFMLLTLGLDSQFAGIETITTSLQDSFPEALKSRSSLLTVVTCIVLFLLGLPCVTQTGIYWVKLMDHFCAGWMLLITAVLELIGIIYIYGGSRFIKDIEMMIGPKNLLFWLWWKACWYLISPIVLAVILVWSLFTFTPPTYDSVVYPEWGVSLGWCMTAFCLMWIPAFAVWKLAKAEGSFWQRCKAASLATNSWGPYLDCHRGDRYKKQQSSGLDMKVTSNVYSINSNLTPV